MRSLDIAVLVSALALPAVAHASFDVPRDETAPLRALDLAPSPNLTPHQVVEVQLGALAANAEWGQDRGIALTFRFASPGNRRVTGPLARFADMVRGSAYAPLLDHQRAQIGPIQMHHGAALLPVVLRDASGQDRGFVWALSRQRGGEHDGCWMTDAVYPAPLSAVQPALQAGTNI